MISCNNEKHTTYFTGAGHLINIPENFKAIKTKKVKCQGEETPSADVIAEVLENSEGEKGTEGDTRKQPEL